MPLDQEAQCSACKINNSLMWRKGASGEILCNSCHLKRVGSNTRSQRQSSKESRKLVARIRASSRKGHWNGKGGDRGKERGRRTISKIKRKVCAVLHFTHLAIPKHLFCSDRFMSGEITCTSLVGPVSVSVYRKRCLFLLTFMGASSL